jgi:hypothetical protein
MTTEQLPTPEQRSPAHEQPSAREEQSPTREQLQPSARERQLPTHEQPPTSEQQHPPTREERLLARQQRELDARAALQPLGPDERPRPLLVAVAVAVLLALGILVGVATIHNLSSHGGSLSGGIFLAAVLLGLAWGMYGRHYWAVLGFEALLAFQIIVTSLALIVAETWLAAGLCVVSIGLAGWLFWKLVRVMGRIQVATHQPQAGQAETDEALR